ncbi:MAG: hypothetical protein BWX79_02798 [Alphaproteobacteria bacterium ADurb.Bin100]|nr:MAG: hypothetical protein BWX79_02798 [Alphaproteobacteria bacterium ADurb.Bin100]
MLSAITAARGVSIIVPSRYSSCSPRSANTAAAVWRITFAWASNSRTVPTSGTMISALTSKPRAFMLRAASITARACISVISG